MPPHHIHISNNYPGWGLNHQGRKNRTGKSHQLFKATTHECAPRETQKVKETHGTVPANIVTMTSNQQCVCVYIYTHTLRSPTPHGPSLPVTNTHVTLTNSLGSEQHSRESTPVPPQHTSCRGDCTLLSGADTAPETPWSPALFTKGYAFTAVTFSLGSRYHRLGSQAEHPILSVSVNSAGISAFLSSIHLWPFCEHSRSFATRGNPCHASPWLQTLLGRGQTHATTDNIT